MYCSNTKEPPQPAQTSDDAKLINMMPIVFTKRLDDSELLKKQWFTKYTKSLEMLSKISKPKYNPKNVSKDRIGERIDIHKYRVLEQKLHIRNRYFKKQKKIDLQVLQSSIDLQTNRVEEQQTKSYVIDETIENDTLNLIRPECNTTPVFDEGLWSSDDDEALINLKTDTTHVPSKSQDDEMPRTPPIDNFIDMTKFDGETANEMNTFEPLSIVFNNEGIMAIQQDTKQECFDTDRAGNITRFYIQLPLPLLENVKVVTRSVCCLYKRANVINDIVKDLLINSRAANFMRTIHNCPPRNCLCCCKNKFNEEEILQWILQSTLGSPTLSPKKPELNVSRSQDSPNIFNTPHLQNLAKYFNSTFSGAKLTVNSGNKLSAVLNATWGVADIRKLTEVLQQISKAITSNGVSARDFCEKVNTMSYKRTLFSSASKLLRDKQLKSIIFMKWTDINSVKSSTCEILHKKASQKESNNRKPKANKLPVHVSKIRKIDKAILNKRKYNRSYGESIPVTDIVTQLTKSHRNKSVDNEQNKRGQRPLRNNNTNTMNQTSTITRPENIQTENKSISVSTRILSGTVTKNPILYQIISDLTPVAAPEKFNLTKIPLQYLVSKTLQECTNNNVSTNPKSNNKSEIYCIELSSDEESVNG